MITMDPVGAPWTGVDAGALAEAVREQAARPMRGIENMATCLAAQVADTSHREVMGPSWTAAARAGPWSAAAR